MEIAIVIVFVLGYLAITLEHSLKIDKLIPALLMMALAWALVAFGIDGFDNWFVMHGTEGELISIGDWKHEGRMHLMESTLLHHFGKTCEILIFLVGAMTIVEIIDHYDGFSSIKDFIKTNSKRTLLWIIAILAFILSAIIDNLTATIVLITILRKILDKREDRLWFAGMIIIAANAGGAWSPIGDVTTTMLWIGKKVTTGKLIANLLLPSLICMVVPTLIASMMPAFKGTFEAPKDSVKTNPKGPLMLYLGLLMILFVPVFKTVTHLPPYIGMMLSLGIVSMVAELISNRQFSLSHRIDGEIQPEEDHGDGNGDAHGGHNSPTFKALGRIEMPSILFFLGILMTVAAMESLGLIFQFGQDVNASMDQNVFISSR